MVEDFQFKGGNPGAVRYGNFINYYKFHPPEERIKFLAKNILEVNNNCIALDVGCNAGNLTFALGDLLKGNIEKEVNILGIDIDPVLIKRAQELNKNANIVFHCLDIMDQSKREEMMNAYLVAKNVDKFNITFCFSTTMWIHLNYGDAGLKSFLKYIAGVSEMLVIEPQPWKCYKNAVKRMKQQDFIFPLFSSLIIKNNIESEI